MKHETLYIMVRVRVETAYEHISDTVSDIETKAKLSLSSTEKVRVQQTEILITRVRNLKNIYHGA